MSEFWKKKERYGGQYLSTKFGVNPFDGFLIRNPPSQNPASAPEGVFKDGRTTDAHASAVQVAQIRAKKHNIKPF